MYIVQKDDNPIDIIEHKFPVPGRSFFPNDSNFGDIEKHLKYHKNVYTMEDYSAVCECRPRKEPFEVSTMIPENCLYQTDFIIPHKQEKNQSLEKNNRSRMVKNAFV